MKRYLLLLLLLLACQSGGARSAANVELDTDLSDYGKEYQRLAYESQLAEWESIPASSRVTDRTRTKGDAPGP